MLTVDLIPSTSWWDNVRSKFPKTTWDKLRKKVYERANHRCEICGASGLEQGFKKAVEAHEEWDYDIATRIQKLVRLVALCPKCHAVKHFGRTQILGKEREAILHLMKVNNWSKEDVILHIRQAFVLWHDRSQVNWTLNLEALELLK